MKFQVTGYIDIRNYLLEDAPVWQEFETTVEAKDKASARRKIKKEHGFISHLKVVEKVVKKRK